MTKQEFSQLFQDGIVLLDGAMGTNMYKAGMTKTCCVEAWQLSHPEIVSELQREYVNAGARIIYAPTFGANRERLGKFSLSERIEEMNTGLVAISKEAACDQAFVAGDIAPTGLLLKELGGVVSAERLFEIYREQAVILYKAGCDLYAIETMTSVPEAEIAVDAVQSVCSSPIICTLSVRRNGAAYYGGNVFEGALRMQERNVDAYGINCGSGFGGLEEVIRKLDGITDIPIVAKPNAGIPHLGRNGDYVYDYSPSSFVSEMRKLIDAGASMVGGCCGTDPAYIRKLKQICMGWPMVNVQ